GKSTQPPAVLSHLQGNGIKVKLLKFSNGSTPIVGKMIDPYYLKSQSDMEDRTTHLLFSATYVCYHATAASIERDLSADILILADRYAFAEMLYQAKVSPSEWCRSPEISILAHNPLIISHLIKL
ncbi:hypothetical protein M378DRAFT_80469, partial [Amanita muscaria Koide BX008]